MKFLNIAFLLLTITIFSCNSEKKETVKQPFCNDTSCLTEPLIVKSELPGKPFVRVTFKDCKIDSIHTEKGGMGVIKDIIFSEFIPNSIKPAKEAMKIDIIEGKFAWMRFNDCATGRGYAVKLNFDKGIDSKKLTTALNNFDPKYKVEEGLVVYYDNTFIYVQDMTNDKIAKQLLTDVGVRNHDVNDPHSLIDSVNITKQNLYAKILFEGKTIEHNKQLEFK